MPLWIEEKIHHNASVIAKHRYQNIKAKPKQDATSKKVNP